MDLTLELRNLGLQALDALVQVDDQLVVVTLANVLSFSHVHVDATRRGCLLLP